MLQSFTADYVFPVSSPSLKNGFVIADDSGQIIDVLPQEKFNSENFNEDIQHHSLRGIICPGFINAHCHLELSHLEKSLKKEKRFPHLSVRSFMDVLLKKKSSWML
jgi:cytosine/adenosine deaminase-related metal-dependent hydrolase